MRFHRRFRLEGAYQACIPDAGGKSRGFSYDNEAVARGRAIDGRRGRERLFDASRLGRSLEQRYAGRAKRQRNDAQSRGHSRPAGSGIDAGRTEAGNGLARGGSRANELQRRTIARGRRSRFGAAARAHERRRSASGTCRPHAAATAFGSTARTVFECSARRCSAGHAVEPELFGRARNGRDGVRGAG